jgi:hypothetical protein
MTSNNNIKWMDIGELCNLAAKELSNSTPMITSQSFSLFESMSAVEVIIVMNQFLF